MTCAPRENRLIRLPQDNEGYNELFNFYLDNKYQLRYTGGMVPDVNQVR